MAESILWIFFRVTKSRAARAGRNPQKKCITLLYDNKTYSLGAAVSGVGPIPLNTPIRVVGYGLTGGPGVICPGTIGMVVRHVQPEPGGKCN